MMSDEIQNKEDSKKEIRFEDLGLNQSLLTAIDALGWDLPTPVQRESILWAKKGKDLIVQARTGTGKTGAFTIPLIDGLIDLSRNEAQALILSPTRELAHQNGKVAQSLAPKSDLQVAVVTGGASYTKQEKKLGDGSQIVSGTPGRILDHLRRGTFDPSAIKYVILDEADEMLSMGFLEEVKAILDKLPPTRNTWLYSATTPDALLRMSERYLKEPHHISLSGDVVGALGIEHIAYTITSTPRLQALLQVLDVEDPESAVIFCNTKKDTEQVANELKRNGFNAAFINGDLPQSKRNEVLEATQSRNVRYLVATDVAARGIDISHLTHVINYELPENTESYIHRTGRTGRAGRTGVAISLIAAQELGRLYYLRLEYGVTPNQRSLPSPEEKRARKELDMIERLDRLVSRLATPKSRDLVKRMFTHERGELVLAGIVETFLSTESEGVAENERRAGQGHRKKPRQEASKKQIRKKARPTESRSRSSEKRDDEQYSSVLPIFLNIGHSDGIDEDRLTEFLLEHAPISANEIADLRIKDRHSFIDVPGEKREAICEALTDATYNDRDVRAENAKARRRRKN